VSGRTALLAAGGTGGHLFPAQALAAVLAARGWTVDLATDERVESYGGDFPARAVHVVPSETIRSKSPLALARTGLRIGQGLVSAAALMRRVRPAVVVGFGGYPSIPPMLAARLLGVPTILHEANAVMGRANRALAPLVTRLATSWPQVRFVEGRLAAKATRTGIPVRPAVQALAGASFPEPGERLRVLVFGGSQGARVFADLAPPALERLDAGLRARIDLVQQVRPEDHDRVRAAYAAAGVAAELAPFFSDLPARMAAAHLVVSRSGASTVAELAAIGRPAVLVPLPHALDSDQLRNAEAMARVGGAVVAEQAGLTPEWLAAILADLLADPARLAAMAAAALTVGAPDAAERLADLAEAMAR
jgi:UDP-N-acetylglucosamine--N-acetylmuramyl-(pentapeptide) pyrophosphoryl-undecaprenol N-acetylglucosamine transferase